MNLGAHTAQGTGTGQDDTYVIPDEVMQKYPDLVELIKQTASMAFDERQYWFHVLPIMNPEQVERLRQILVQEKEQLKKLDAKYDAELKALNEKHVIEWQDFQRKKKQEELSTAEAKAESEEHTTEQALLNRLGDV